MLGDFRIDGLAAQRFEAFERAFLMCPHQPRIPRHIGSEDRGKTARLAHVASPAAIRTPDRYSSRWSGFRKRLTVGITLGVMRRSRAITSRASSIRPICA